MSPYLTWIRAIFLEDQVQFRCLSFLRDYRHVGLVYETSQTSQQPVNFAAQCSCICCCRLRVLSRKLENAGNRGYAGTEVGPVRLGVGS